MDNYIKCNSTIDLISGCWVWNKRGYKGYGSSCIVLYNGKRVSRPHQLSYLVYKGEYDNNLLVCHTCNNRACVNPEHLYVGTPQDNSRDMVKAGNSTKGSKNPSSKLNECQVKQIKENLYMKDLELSSVFNVTKSCINSIRNGINWGWL